MAARISNRRWLLRDIPRLGVLSIWALISFGILLYCFDLPAFQRVATSGSQPRMAAGAHTDPGNDQRRYTGSILFVPTRGDLCSQWIIDNRNGKMWDNGQVNCKQASEAARPDDRSTAARMLTIGKAFKGD